MYVKWWSIDQRHNSVTDKYPIIYIKPHEEATQVIWELEIKIFSNA